MLTSLSALKNGSVATRFKEKGLRIGILHSGGPAPGGNRVLYSAALRAKDLGVPLLAFEDGYQHLEQPFSASDDKSWIVDLASKEAQRNMRDQGYLLSRTDRANPGKVIKKIEDLGNTKKTAGLTCVLDVFEALRIGALISIGGDDTMRTSSLLTMHLNNLRAQGRVFNCFEGAVHVPKTIDKDYRGIDYTFGFWTAAQKYGETVRGLHGDAHATGTRKQAVYHVAEIMGRGAGWLTAVASIFGGATFAFVPEDYKGRNDLTFQELAKHGADIILARQEQGKYYGVFSICEGLGDLLNVEAEKDEFGHSRFATADVGGSLQRAIEDELRDRGIGFKFKSTSRKLGYEARQVIPNIYDDLLCRRLGISAVDAILSGNYGNMVSIEGVLNPKLIPFEQLFDPTTVKIKSWPMSPDEGMYQLMRAMENPDYFNRK